MVRYTYRRVLATCKTYPGYFTYQLQLKTTQGFFSFNSGLHMPRFRTPLAIALWYKSFGTLQATRACRADTEVSVTLWK